MRETALRGTDSTIITRIDFKEVSDQAGDKSPAEPIEQI